MALQSGSNGNSVYIEAAGVRLLVDAGISGVEMQRRLATQGIDARDIDGLLISHDHSDHVRCMGVYHRKFGIPVYVTNQTINTAHRRVRLGTFEEVRTFVPGASLKFGPVTVETIPTPHDSVDSVGFIVDDGQCRLGVLTDLGHPFDALKDALNSLDAVLLESNYDPQMLEDGPYPVMLQQRIRGPGGHLSNHEAAELLQRAFRGQLKWACLAHLSEHNNEPNLALRTHRQVVGEGGSVMVANRYQVSPMLEV